MEIRDLLVGLACLFGLAGAVVLYPVCRLWMARRVHREKAKALPEHPKQGSSLLRNGVPFLFPVADRILQAKWCASYFDSLTYQLLRQGMFTSSRALSSIGLVIFSAALVVSLLVSGSIVFGLAGFVCLILGVSMWVRRAQDGEREQLREAIPEALQSMKACFHAGFSLPQMFEQLSVEISGPLGRLFAQLQGIMSSGGSVDDALEYVKQQSRESELIFLAAALEIQHKTGSSIAQVLDAARDSVSDEVELKRSLQTQTAQAKLSAQIVTLMPFALVAVFSLVSPGFLAPFFESFLGFVLLAIALAMQVGGVLMVRRFLRVEGQ